MTPAKDPLGLLSDAEYQAWLDERPPVSDAEREEIEQARAEEEKREGKSRTRRRCYRENNK